MNTPLLEVKNLAKSFSLTHGKRLPVLRGVSLKAGENEIISVVGPDCGQVFLAGRNVTGRTGQFAYMMQDDFFLPWKTVAENIALPLVLAGADKKQISRKVTTLARTFGLSAFLQYYPFRLSGGMKQRASLMRVYVHGRKVLLMDEPFGKLDALTRLSVRRWFLKICLIYGAVE